MKYLMKLNCFTESKTYIKTYEGLNKKTVNPNKIYYFYNKLVHASMVGTINPKWGEGGSLMKGYITSIDSKVRFTSGFYIGVEFQSIISHTDWKYVREATTEEIEKYEILLNIKNFNL